MKRDFLRRRLDPLERGLTPAQIAPGVIGVLVARQASSEVRARLQVSLAALRTEPYRQALHAIVTTDFRPVLPTISVPTIVVVGDQDQVTPPSAARFLATRIPDASLVTIAGSGHLSNLEQPERFNAALDAFLAPHTRRASVVPAH